MLGVHGHARTAIRIDIDPEHSHRANAERVGANRISDPRPVRHQSPFREKIEVFSAGCAVCEDTVELVRRIACPSCEVQILDMHRPEVAAKAQRYGIRSVPAVAIDGRLADCCTGSGPDEAALRAAGIGTPL